MSSSEVYQILRELVACKSIFGQEQACGLLLEEMAGSHDLPVEIQAVEDKRNNLLFTLGADSYRDGRHALLFHGHYDTVPGLDMPDAFNLQVRDGFLRGRGSVDQKGGLAAALAALIAVKRSGREFKRSLCLAAVVDEESEHRGSYTLIREGIEADYAIVTEPTHLKKVEFGCRGSAPLKISVEGKTAHAGSASEGVNAIQQALPVLEKLFSMDFQVLDLGELGQVQGSLCVSMMEAGTGYNNVPHQAVIWMDRRTVPGEDTALALAEIQALLDQAQEENPDLSARLEVARPDWSWPPIMERGLNPSLTPASTELFQVLQRAADKSGVGKLEKAFASCYYDMDFLVNDLGIPTLVYGPGDGRLNHSAAEAVAVDDVCRAAELYCHMAEELCLEG